MMSSRLPVVVQQYWDHMDESGEWMWLWATLGMFLFVVAIGVVVGTVTRATQHHPPAAVNRAREILAERYARGELSTDEHHERIETLRGRPKGR